MTKRKLDDIYNKTSDKSCLIKAAIDPLLFHGDITGMLFDESEMTLYILYAWEVQGSILLAVI